MALLVILLPLINFLLLSTASHFVNWRQLVALVLVSKSLVLGWSAANFEQMISGEIKVTKIGEWFDFGLLNASWTFSCDALTHVMIFTVMLVSTLVHTYSIAYMSEDPHLPRFLSYLSLFTFFMLILISSDNFVNLFLGWEGVGLCSYLLISFWYSRLQANKAALKAMIVNRIADMALTLGILTIFYTFQTTEFNVVFAVAPYLSEARILFFGFDLAALSICAALLFIGAMGKSAQIGLHTWLPDAMEGKLNRLTYGLSMYKKILPYAGTAALDTSIDHLSLTDLSTADSTLLAAAAISIRKEKVLVKFDVDAANPQETDQVSSGSSETLRKTSTPFNFTSFRTECRTSKAAQPTKINTALEWLVGFAEGDGSFIVNEDGTLSFQITQSVRDVQILHQVRKFLGFGAVRVQDKDKEFPTWRYVVTDRANLKKIIYLFNGNLALEKNHLRFAPFLSAFNRRFKEEIPLLSTRTVPSLTSGWLSGFTDAEGCFTVSVLDRATARGYQVQARLIIPQKGAKMELEALALLLGGRLSFLKSYNGYNLTVNFTFLKKALQYYCRFPLKTKKRIPLIKFLSVYNLLIAALAKKRPLTAVELTFVRKRAKEINPDWRLTFRRLCEATENSLLKPEPIALVGDTPPLEKAVVEDKVRSSR